MKKFLFYLTLVAGSLFTPMPASAFYFAVANDDGVTIYYDIYDSDARVVKGDEKYSGVVNIPETATYNGTTYNVTSIGSIAFYECSGLTEVTIPNSVTSIGNQTFEGCSGLTEVTIPNSVTSIGSGAFSGCSGLTEVTIPNSVTSIGDKAFYSCSGLTEVTIPNSVTSIYSKTFSGCSGLIEVTIPNSVTSIGSEAFAYCWGLTEVTIPNSVTSIGDGAFGDCSGLTEVTIPNSVTSIGDAAFVYCSGLTEVTIPNSVTSIGDEAFVYCKSLKTVTLADGEGKLAFGTSVFRYDPIETLYVGRSFWCYSNDDGVQPFSKASIKTLTIGNTVTAISYYAFAGCSGLTEVTIPNSVKSIGSGAFYDCSGLTAVTIPNSVTSIGDKAFSGCSSLKKVAKPADLSYDFASSVGVIDYDRNDCNFDDGYIFNADKSILLYVPISKTGTITIPATVTEIGNNAFIYCSNLTEIVPLPENPPVYYDSSFKGLYDTLVINIKSSLWHNYLHSYWIVNFENIKQDGEPVLKESDDVFTYLIDNTNDEACLLRPLDKSMDMVSVPDRVVINDKFYKVTVILSGAFIDMTSLTTVKLSKNLIQIGYAAFYGCSGIKSLTLPDNLTYIGEMAFLGCTGLAEITFNDQLTTIDYGAFYNCSGIKSVTFNDKLTTIGGFAFSGCGFTALKFGKELRTIGYAAFYQCPNLVEVDLNEELSIIDAYAFSYCPSFTTLNINKELTTIGEGAFYNTEITKIDLPNSVTAVGDYAFASCKNLESLTINDSPNPIELGADIISGSPKVTKVFVGRDYTGHPFSSSSVTELTIGNLVSKIENQSFSNCANLKTVSFGSALKSIGDNAFADCKKLEEVVVPQSVTTIGVKAFQGCSSMSGIAIGAGITEIGEMAFDGVNSAKGVSVTAPQPPMASNNTFSNYDMPLYVSEGSIEDYYNFTRCWYRFTGYKLLPIKNVNISSDGQSLVNLNPGDIIKLSAEISPLDADLPYIFWESTNPNFAIVDNQGVVTVLDNGDIEPASRAESEGAANSCKIIAKTLYGDIAAEVTLSGVGSGINDIIVDNAETVRPNHIYTLQGVCLKQNASQADIDALAPGLYIIGGKKVYIR